MNVNELTVLIADDTPVSINVIRKFLELKGVNVVHATNGQEAIDRFVDSKPDIVVMDVMMPVKNGYEATKEIKAIAGDKWIPLIFLSSKNTADDHVAGLNAGGDAYLTKPVDLAHFDAKMTAMLRIVEMQRKLSVAKQALKVFADKATAEIALAKQLMQKMVQRNETVKPEYARIFSEPAEDISGDIVLSFQCENPSQSYFILADATGHGLSAAISIIPMAQLFYRLASENVCVSAIVNQINARLESILPVNRFVAATVGFVDREAKTIEVWNGANPCPRLVGTDGHLIHTFDQNNYCLGVVPENAFTHDSETFHYKENGELLFFSDGIIDAQNSKGEAFGKEGLVAAISSTLSPGQTMFDKILADLNAFRDHQKRIDDICILSVNI